jgi:hypothetical protein
VSISVGVGSGRDVPEFAACALELGVEERMLEADGVSVAPSLETCGIAEGERLGGSQSAPWDVFAFDIEASCCALKVELDRPCAPLSADRAVAHCFGTWTNRSTPIRRPPWFALACCVRHCCAPALDSALPIRHTTSLTIDAISAASAAAGAS